VVAWGLLSVIYSITVTLVLQPLLENALKREIAFTPLWLTTCSVLLIPGVLEYLPLPSLSFRWKFLGFVSRDSFSESMWRTLGGYLAPLYLRHDLRRGTTWLTVFFCVLLGSLLPSGKSAFWVLISQLPLQRALYSVHHWRRLALAFQPKNGAKNLMGALWTSQFIQLVVSWTALGAMQVIPQSEWLALGPASLGAMVAAGSMTFEGDSGRPWMVNFLALAAGTIGGFLCLISPWFLLLVIYFSYSMSNIVSGRLLSVEHLDEDTVIP